MWLFFLQAEKEALEEYSVLPARILSALDHRQQALRSAADGDNDCDAFMNKHG